MSGNDVLNRIRGSLIGGAAGDALGYPVEFLDEEQIAAEYGQRGITAYTLCPYGDLALISDDTQMTLFTASALLYGIRRQKERGVSGEPRQYAMLAYLGWFKTQQAPYSAQTRIPDGLIGWASCGLRDIPALYCRRAPGLTCLSALETRLTQLEAGETVGDFLADRINDSKGCGGIMRVAPLGMAVSFWDSERLAMEGAQLAAITHSHSLGYMPAAVLALLVNRLVYATEAVDLRQTVVEVRDTVARLFRDDPHSGALMHGIDLALALAENGEPDVCNIHRLGEGWVAEETLAIALYCCLRHPSDFSGALIAAVNHRGDSDSTGAVTGNIMGALLGFDAIGEPWRTGLELYDEILRMADALYGAFHEQ